MLKSMGNKRSRPPPPNLGGVLASFISQSHGQTVGPYGARPIGGRACNGREIESGGAQTAFPVTAADLMPDLQGPALGARLKDLQNRWLDSNLRLNRDELLG